MSGLSVSSVFQNTDLFQGIILLLDLADVGRASQVCRSWKSVIEKSAKIWKSLFAKEGIPLVISLNGKPRDYKQDFQILYPITLSGKKISRFIGKMVGEVPSISEKWLLKLSEEDAFEKDKSLGENYVFVVTPPFLTRTVDQDTPLALDKSGNLIESPLGIVANQELSIPLSFKNLRILCSYPLKGKENTPVFDKTSLTEVFNQCHTCADKVRVYFMRKHIANQSKGVAYVDQEELVKRHGFEVTPLIVRALFDSITILDSGTCPDDRKPWAFTRNRDTVLYNNVYQSIIGGFALRAGMRVDCISCEDAFIVVAPCVPADGILSINPDHSTID